MSEVVEAHLPVRKSEKAWQNLGPFLRRAISHASPNLENFRPKSFLSFS